MRASPSGVPDPILSEVSFVPFQLDFEIYHMIKVVLDSTESKQIIEILIQKIVTVDLPCAKHHFSRYRGLAENKKVLPSRLTFQMRNGQ